MKARKYAKKRSYKKRRYVKKRTYPRRKAYVKKPRNARNQGKGSMKLSWFLNTLDVGGEDMGEQQVMGEEVKTNMTRLIGASSNIEKSFQIYDGLDLSLRSAGGTRINTEIQAACASKGAVNRDASFTTREYTHRVTGIKVTRLLSDSVGCVIVSLVVGGVSKCIPFMGKKMYFKVPTNVMSIATIRDDFYPHTFYVINCGAFKVTYYFRSFPSAQSWVTGAIADEEVEVFSVKKRSRRDEA